MSLSIDDVLERLQRSCDRLGSQKAWAKNITSQPLTSAMSCNIDVIQDRRY
jgi:hypothetical protein